MSESKESALEALAYLRGVAADSGSGQVSRSTGLLFAVAGFAYGAQALLIWATMVGLPTPPGTGLLSAAAATGVFIAACIYVFWRERGGLIQKGVAARAISGLFAGAGIANAAMVIAFGSAASKAGDWSIWALYPSVLAALQGAAWFAAAMISRRLWLGVVAFGWYATAALLGVLVGDARYMLVLGLGLAGFMGGPGLYLMLRKPTMS